MYFHTHQLKLFLQETNKNVQFKNPQFIFCNTVTSQATAIATLRLELWVLFIEFLMKLRKVNRKQIVITQKSK